MKAPHHDRLEERRNQRLALRWGAASLAAVIGGSLLVAALVMWRETPSHSVVSAPQSVSLPPQPRLQADPAADRREYLERRRRLLHEWAPAGDGYARVPIEVAIDVMSERGGWRRKDESQ